MYHANIFGHLLSICLGKRLILSIRQSLPRYFVLKPTTLIVSIFDSFLSRFSKPQIIFNSFSGKKDHTSKLLYPISLSKVILNNPFIIKPNKKFYKNKNSKKERQEINILSLSRNDKSKDFEYLFKLVSLSASSLKFINLSIYGDNITQIDRSYLKPINNNKYIKLSLNEAIKDLKDVLHKSDIYLSTSLWEGYPNSLVTASVAGCIPICTNAGDSWKLLGSNCYKLTKNIDEDVRLMNIAFSDLNKTTHIQRSNKVLKKLDEFGDSFLIS